MFYFRMACPLLLVLVLTGVAGAAASSPPVTSHAKAPAAADAKSPPPKTPGKTTLSKDRRAPHADAKHMGAALGAGSSWYLDGSPNKARGAVWEQGVPMENLLRKRRAGEPASAGVPGAAPRKGADPGKDSSAVAGTVDTKKGIDSALGAISSYERQPADGSALGLNKPGAPSVQMTTEESAWRNPVTQPMPVGQEVMATRRNVVGAYADVVKNDDLRVTMGPELHIPDTEAGGKHLTPHQAESSTLGFGMKWQWDF